MQTSKRTKASLLGILAGIALLGLVGTASAQPRGGGTPMAMPCPDEVRATALADGDVRVEWDEVEEADYYQVVVTGPGDEVRVLNTQRTEGPDDATFLVDTGTEAGTTYTYDVIPSSEERFFLEEDCPSVQVTAIPFFGSGAIGTVAALGTVGAFLLYRRGL